MDKLVVIGGGGHARVLMSVLRKLHWDVLGYTDERDNGTIRGLVRLGDDTALQSLLEAHTGCAAVVGVGKVDTSPLRMHLQDLAEDLGFEIPVIVSPDATVNADVALERRHRHLRWGRRQQRCPDRQGVHHQHEQHAGARLLPRRQRARGLGRDRLR